MSIYNSFYCYIFIHFSIGILCLLNLILLIRNANFQKILLMSNVSVANSYYLAQPLTSTSIIPFLAIN